MKEGKFPPTTFPWTGTSPKGFFNALDLVFCAGGGFDSFFFIAIYILTDKQADDMFDDHTRDGGSLIHKLIKVPFEKRGISKIFHWVLSKVVQQVGNILGTPLKRQ